MTHLYLLSQTLGHRRQVMHREGEGDSSLEEHLRLPNARLSLISGLLQLLCSLSLTPPPVAFSVASHLGSNNAANGSAVHGLCAGHDPFCTQGALLKSLCKCNTDLVSWGRRQAKGSSQKQATRRSSNKSNMTYLTLSLYEKPTRA